MLVMAPGPRLRLADYPPEAASPWLYPGTATLAAVFEEVAVHTGGVAGLLVSGSDTWGQWLGGSIAIVLTMPLAAFATSVTYIHLTVHKR